MEGGTGDDVDSKPAAPQQVCEQHPVLFEPAHAHEPTAVAW